MAKRRLKWLDSNNKRGRLEKKHSVYRDGRRYTPYDHDLNYGCGGKIKFKTLSAAERHIEKHFPEDFDMEPYKCKKCGKYHIGHSKKRRRHGQRD